MIYYYYFIFECILYDQKHCFILVKITTAAFRTPIKRTSASTQEVFEFFCIMENRSLGGF